MYEVVFTRYFKRKLKELMKKDHHLELELRKTLSVFKKDHAIFIGRSIVKIRLRGHNKGRSGGYRAYLLLLEIHQKLVPLCIYAKNEQENISKKELIGHMARTMDELREME